jgi:arginyl-tRNA synthetase
MHVGHLRSTIIGDCLVRTLEYLGHRVIRQNHIGDWGTPFGMLIEHLLDCGSGTGGADLRELSAFYRAARVKFDTDETFAQRARHRVVRLQQGDVVTLELWGRLIDTTAVYMEALYARLHVTFGREHMVGESHYNAQLQQVVDELERSGLAQPSLKTAQLAGWAPAQVRLQHVAFGSVLGQDGKCSRRALERPSAWIS